MVRWQPVKAQKSKIFSQFLLSVLGSRFQKNQYKDDNQIQARPLGRYNNTHISTISICHRFISRCASCRFSFALLSMSDVLIVVFMYGIFMAQKSSPRWFKIDHIEEKLMAKLPNEDNVLDADKSLTLPATGKGIDCSIH